MERPNLARVKPDITVKENYHYISEIRENRFTDYENGHGELKIKYKMGDITGFDDYAYYDLMGQPIDPPGKQRYEKGSLSDLIKRKISDDRAGNKLRHNSPILVGRLAVLNHENTDIQESLSLDYDIKDLYLPTSDINKEVFERNIYEKKIDYNVDEPEGNILSVRAEFTDETGINIYQIVDENNKIDLERFKDVCESTSTFKDEAILEITIKLSIPKRIDRNTPTLPYACLEWPISFGDIEPLERNPEYPVYDPERERLEWKKIRFNEDKKNVGESDLFSSYKAKIGFKIANPSILFDVAELNGKFFMNFSEILLSETELKFFDPTGKEKKRVNKNNINMPIINKKTKIKSDINIDLQGIFKQKKYIPYRHLEFEGVTPEDKRISDIEKTLQDNGIKLDEYKRDEHKSHDDQDNLKSREVAILGKSKIGATTARIGVLIQGEKKEMEKRVQLEGGYTGTTQVETGNTSVLMFGSHPDNKKLSKKFDEISNSLNDKFTQVTIIS